MKKLLISGFLVGCQSFEPPPGPCQLPPVTHQLGQQTWQSPGPKTWDEPSHCLAMGGLYRHSRAARHTDIWQARADAGETEAMVQLGQWALAEHPPRFDEARALFQNAWALGDGQGAWFLAHMARHGLGQAPDPLASTNYLQQAAGQEKLVPARRLATAEHTRDALIDALAQQQAENAQVTQALASLQKQWSSRPKTPLYRFDLGGDGGCGIDLDWQAFGSGAAGLSLAVDAFEQQYSDQAWLWLDTSTAARTDLWEQVYQEILITSPAWLVVNGQTTQTHHPRIWGEASPASGHSQHGPSTIEWGCDE